MLTTVGILSASCIPVWQKTNIGSPYTTGNCRTGTTTYQDYVYVDVACNSGTQGGGTSVISTTPADNTKYVVDIVCNPAPYGRVTYYYVYEYCDGTSAGTSSPVSASVCPAM